MTTATTTTTTMRAVVQRGYGRPEDVLRLAEVPRPEPRPGEVLVRIRATSVNTPDWVTVLGEPRVLRLMAGPRTPRTPIRGTDVAGVVERVGSGVTDLAVGDEVFGSAWTEGIATAGAFCEYAVVPATMLARKPAAVPWTDAAVSVMSALTAVAAVRDVATLGPGSSVLINGASGGVGTFMVQLARAAGADVTAVCSGRNVGLVRSLGATDVVDYTTTDLAEIDRRYDVVVDNVLNRPGATMARLVRRGGLLVPNSVGQGGRLAGGLPRMAWTMMRGLLWPLRVATIGYDVTRRDLDEIGAMLADGRLRAVIDSTHPLAAAHRAVARMVGRHARGNVAITVT